MVETFPNLEELNLFAAEEFVSVGQSAIERNGKFVVALAGGSTPKSLYRLLTTEKFKSRIDWKKVFFFFGDERNVAPDADDSNFRMAHLNLLEPLQVSAENTFRWQTELGDAEKIAEKYEQTIKEFFDLAENDFPRFDLILLGMGDDGHTASLFPFSEALRETKRIAVTNPVEKLNAKRLTFTFPTINNSANVIFLVSGDSKAEVLRIVLQGEREPEKLPSQNVKLESGNLYWLLDKAAAGKLG